MSKETRQRNIDNEVLEICRKRKKEKKMKEKNEKKMFVRSVSAMRKK